jgi:hypothetical protein
MPSKRDVLANLKRDELQGALQRFDLPVRDRRVRDQLVDALAESPRAPLAGIIEGFSRDRLKEVCRALGLDDGGREKARLIARITEAVSASTSRTPPPVPSSPPRRPGPLAVAPGSTAASSVGAEDTGYLLKISRRTVDKLGVKLYDRISAVVAELVANSYDADAEKVAVTLPLATELARRKDGEVEDKGSVVEVKDDGHGMDPDEARDHYLKVGRDRREHLEQGPTSRKKRRPVMGRKGIGKLAPFGVCRRIEVRSAGGPVRREGFLVSHFFLDYKDIDVDEEKPVPLETGPEDRTFSPSSGTVVRLSHFLPKRVPDLETFSRQLARRFGATCELPDFGIFVADSHSLGQRPSKITRLDIPLMSDTRVDVKDRPVVLEDGRNLSVQGFLAFSKDPFKTEETGGVAI